MALPEPTPHMLHRVYDLFGPALHNQAQAIEWQSPAKARLLYAALERVLADLTALYAMPPAEAEAAATALRLQAEAQDKRDRPEETK